MEGNNFFIKKDFDAWNKLKKNLHYSEKKIYFKEKEIWWCSLGINIGYEQDGKNNNFERPIVVLRKFNNDLLWIIPLTTGNKSGKYYYSFENNNKKYSAILSQIRLISTKRLVRKMRKMSDENYISIKKSLIRLA